MGTAKAPGDGAGAGGIFSCSPIDALPDELVARFISLASECSGADRELEAGAVRGCSASRYRNDRDLRQILRLSHVSRRFRCVALDPSLGLWRRVLVQPATDAAVGALLSQPRECREAVSSIRLRDGDLSGESLIKLSEAFGGHVTEFGVTLQNGSFLCALAACSSAIPAT
eukprot:tig00000113_g5694.t1